MGEKGGERDLGRGKGNLEAIFSSTSLHGFFQCSTWLSGFFLLSLSSVFVVVPQISRFDIFARDANVVKKSRQSKSSKNSFSGTFVCPEHSWHLIWRVPYIRPERLVPGAMWLVANHDLSKKNTKLVLLNN